MAAFKQLARTHHVRALCLQKFGVPPEGTRAPAGIHHRALVHFLSHVDVAQRVRQREEDAVVAAVLERVPDMFNHVNQIESKVHMDMWRRTDGTQRTHVMAHAYTARCPRFATL